jgi:hypothetical protein
MQGMMDQSFSVIGEDEKCVCNCRILEGYKPLGRRRDRLGDNTGFGPK